MGNGRERRRSKLICTLGQCLQTAEAIDKIEPNNTPAKNAPGNGLLKGYAYLIRAWHSRKLLEVLKGRVGAIGRHRRGRRREVDRVVVTPEHIDLHLEDEERRL